jgi:hypothetical protein
LKPVSRGRAEDKVNVRGQYIEIQRRRPNDLKGCKRYLSQDSRTTHASPGGEMELCSHQQGSQRRIHLPGV